MFLIAITGGIACGKSSVAEIFEKHDVPVISSDFIARQSKNFNIFMQIKLILFSFLLTFFRILRD
jgi:dephospho-CoA kinase